MFKDQSGRNKPDDSPGFRARFDAAAFKTSNNLSTEIFAEDNDVPHTDGRTRRSASPVAKPAGLEVADVYLVYEPAKTLEPPADRNALLRKELLTYAKSDDVLRSKIKVVSNSDVEWLQRLIPLVQDDDQSARNALKSIVERGELPPPRLRMLADLINLTLSGRGSQNRLEVDIDEKSDTVNVKVQRGNDVQFITTADSRSMRKKLEQYKRQQDIGNLLVEYGQLPQLSHSELDYVRRLTAAIIDDSKAGKTEVEHLINEFRYGIPGSRKIDIAELEKIATIVNLNLQGLGYKDRSLFVASGDRYQTSARISIRRRDEWQSGYLTYGEDVNLTVSVDLDVALRKELTAYARGQNDKKLVERIDSLTASDLEKIRRLTNWLDSDKALDELILRRWPMDDWGNGLDNLRRLQDFVNISIRSRDHGDRSVQVKTDAKTDTIYVTVRQGDQGRTVPVLDSGALRAKLNHYAETEKVSIPWLRHDQLELLHQLAGAIIDDRYTGRKEVQRLADQCRNCPKELVAIQDALNLYLKMKGYPDRSLSAEPERDHLTVTVKRQNSSQILKLALDDYVTEKISDSEANELEERYRIKKSELRGIRQEINANGRNPLNLIRELAQNHRILAVDDQVERSPFGTELIPEIKKAQVTHLALSLEPRIWQSTIDKFMQNGTIDHLLRNRSGTFLELLKAARNANLQVVCVGQPTPRFTPEEARNACSIISQILENDKNNKVLYLAHPSCLRATPDGVGNTVVDGLKQKYPISTIYVHINNGLDPDHHFITRDLQRPVGLSLQAAKHLGALDRIFWFSPLKQFDHIIIIPDDPLMKLEPKRGAKGNKLIDLAKQKEAASDVDRVITPMLRGGAAMKQPFSSRHGFGSGVGCVDPPPPKIDEREELIREEPNK